MIRPLPKDDYGESDEGDDISDDQCLGGAQLVARLQCRAMGQSDL